MESIKIVSLAVFASVLYGISHDQITARICVEYFTIGHPPVFNTDSPTLLAFGWGVIATWWMGVFLGVPAAICSRLSSWPKRSMRQLIKPIGILLIVMGIASFTFGLIGYTLAKAGSIWLLEPMKTLIPADRHPLFLCDLWAHVAAYAVGFFGGLACCGWIVFRRYRDSMRLIA